MDRALVTDLRAGQDFEMSAADFEQEIAGNRRLKIETKVPDWHSRYEFIDLNSGAPMSFHHTYTRNGNEQKVSACFARAAGYGDRDHVFNHDRNQSLPDAVAAGKSVLLSLNTDLSYRALDYRNMRTREGMSLGQFWSAHRKNYVSVSVFSVSQVIKEIKHLEGLSPGILKSDRVFALYRGGVMPYRNFYMGGRSEDISNLYDRMAGMKSGIKHGETRAIGFPRLFRFEPSKSTLKERGSQGLKSKPIWRSETQTRLFSSLIFSDDREKTSGEMLRHFEAVSTSDKGLYVMAAPTISRERKNAQNVWRQLRWIVNDFDAQTMPAIAPGA